MTTRACWLLCTTLLGVSVSASGCRRDPSVATIEPAVDAGSRRWLKAPSNEVRAFPPHAIRSDGVGPYLLGAPLAEVLQLLPGGPRVELLQVGALTNWRVVKAEAGTLQIGADTDNRVGYVAVLSPDVARIDKGFGVGATGADLTKALGSPQESTRVAFDRVVYTFDALPHVEFVTEAKLGTAPAKARVAAVVVSRPADGEPAIVPVPTALVVGPEQKAHRAPVKVVAVHPPTPRCRTSALLGQPSRVLIAVARGRQDRHPEIARPLEIDAGVSALAKPLAGEALRPSADGPAELDTTERADETRRMSATFHVGCFASTNPEVAVVTDGELAIVGMTESATTEGVVRVRARFDAGDFVTVLDVDQDGRDELLVGSLRRERTRAVWELRVYRVEGERVLEALRARPFRFSDAQASTAGVQLADIDLVVRAQAQENVLTLTGLYLARRGDAIVQVAPLAPVELRVRARHGVAAPLK